VADFPSFVVTEIGAESYAVIRAATKVARNGFIVRCS